MKALFAHWCCGFMLSFAFAGVAAAQKPLTWQEIRDKFEAANPTLHADEIGVDESRAQEITAHLRPNPDLSFSADGLQLVRGYLGVWRPLTGVDEVAGISYLHERQHKRELRLESAQKATAIAVSSHSDLERSLLFDLRGAFVQILQQKAVLNLAQENLAYYDHLLSVNRERYKAGAMAQVDLDRLEIQRVQYQSDLQTAIVNLRTAKIQLLTLLNERTPVEQFDVAGPFGFSSPVVPLDDARKTALENRPELKSALQSIDKAKTDHQLAIANGSTDPTFSTWFTHNASFNNPFANKTLGFGVSIPLRVFDRNQGEKLRTQLDIDKNDKTMQATRAQVFSDVDSAYATVLSTVTLLQPYKDKYLQQAFRIRDTISFSYEHGAASLLDFLNAQADYRAVQLNYLTLVGSYLEAVNQLNEAVGREVIP